MSRRGSRYLGILRGSDETARTKLINYLKGIDKVTYSERRVPRPDRAPVFVDAFVLKLATGVKIRQFVNTSRFTSTIAGFFGTRVTRTAPTNAANILVLPGFRTPRVVVTTGRTASGAEATSQISGLRYLDYGGTSVSVPFGPGAADETEGEAFSAIRTAVLANDARNLATFVPGTIEA